MTNDTKNSTQIDFSSEELSQLGLNEHPFIEHAGDTYLFSDDQLDMSSNIIMEYLDNPTTTVVISGEDGLGKTTFLRKILRLGYQQYQFCTLRANHQTSFEDVENKIQQRWPLSSTEVATPPEDLSIENYVISYLNENSHAVLIIDDADSLDLPTLDRLFALKHRVALACSNGLGLILAGDNNLTTYITELEETNPACTQVYQINVRPLTKEQTFEYVKFRLITAGMEEDMLFNDAQLSDIYNLTEGNISLIHEVSTDLLAEQLTEDNSINDILDENIIIRQPKSKLPLLLIPLVLLIGIGLYFNTKQTSNDVDEVALPSPSEAPKTPISSLLEQESNVELTETIVASSEIAEATVEKLPETFPPLEVKLKAKPNEETDSTEKPAVNENTIVKVKEEINAIKEAIQESPAPTTNTSEKIASNDSAVSSGVEWLRSLPGNNYTLQVIATSDINKLETVVQKENLKEQYSLFQKVVKGQTYHVLVVGNFSTRDEAANSINKLSEALQKNKPWPIKLDQVQKHL